jgi:hypothetical protein
MSEKAKPRPFRERVTLVAAGFAVGLAIGLWIGHWENQVKQEAAKVLGETRFIEVMSEDLDRINQYWDSKPEVARALLERQLRAHERLLQSVKTYSGNYALFTEDRVSKDMAFIHVKLAVLCQRLNEPDCVSEHVTKATTLMNVSSNQVYAAMAKFEGTNNVSSRISK